MSESENTSLRFAVISIAVVIVLFVILIFAKSSKSTTATASTNSTGSTLAPSSITADLANVQQTMLDSIGVGSALAGPIPVKAPALTENNKPEILYEGAEFCPYCATERWAMGVALSKFGTFTNLRVTHSSSTDVYANTQTLSFYKSTFTSNYITFTPIEIYTNIPDGNGYTTLEVPTAAESAIVNKYDATPYLPASSAQSIPFIDIGGSYLIAGATYSPTVLEGKTAAQIAGSLSNSSTKIAKGVDGAANTIVAAICKLTNNQPMTTCDGTIQKIGTSL